MSGKGIWIVGGLIVAGFLVYNAYQKRRKDVPIFYRKSLFKNYNARTIPPFGIYVNEAEKGNKELIEHEIVHWNQYQKKGLINYYRDYASEIKQFGYDSMPMEKEARTNETEFCKENYTECVREGKSNTVYNPEFRL